MNRMILVTLFLFAYAIVACCAPPVWFLNHSFPDSAQLFVPSLRGYPPLVETGVIYTEGNVLYYDELSDEWISTGSGSGYSDLRMYGTGGIMLFAGALSIGSFSDGAWRWTAGAYPEVEAWTYLPAFIDVYPDGSCWIIGGTHISGHEILIKYADTGEWSMNLPEFDWYPPITATIASITSPDTMYILTSTALAVSFDGGHNWSFLFEDIFGLETYSPSDMTYDFETGIIYIATWGGLFSSALPFGDYAIDTGCGIGCNDIESVKLSGEKWLLLKSDIGNLLARPVDGEEWEDWTSSLPECGEIVDFGSKGNGAAVLLSNNEIYFADTISSSIKENQLPAQLGLSITPNPFNSSVRVQVSCPGLQIYGIEIFDLKGTLRLRSVPGISRSLSGAETTDNRTFIWQPDESMGSGVFLVRASLQDGSKITKRVIFLK